jgi:hypothetical protein
VIARLALGLLVALAACAGSESDASDDRTVCEVRFAAPSGFAPLDPFEEEYADHIGLRLGFRDPEGREFHVLVGIPGEFGEGMASAGGLALSEDRTGSLFGRDDVWIVRWTEGDVCDPRAVIGNGFSREEFAGALEDAGLA